MGDDHQDRAEDLLLRDASGVVESGDQRRLDEEAPGFVGRTAAADLDGAALLLGDLDVGQDTLSLAFGDQRPADGARTRGVSGRESGQGIAGRGDRLVELGSRHDQTCRDRTALARMGDDVESGHRTGGTEVGVVEHDERGLAAELEEDLLQRFRRRGHHLLAGRGGTGEGDEVDAGGIGAELFAETVICRGDDVQDAGREIGLLGHDLPDERRAPRGVSGAGFRTTVQPAARAGPILAKLIWWGGSSTGG